MIRNVVIPTLTMFAPADAGGNGTAVIVAPGGAFHFLMMNHEGAALPGIADDDELVPPMSSTRLHQMWRRAGAPAELHVFGDGGHGFGANTLRRRADSWRDLFRGWLAGHGYLSPLEQGSRL